MPVCRNWQTRQTQNLLSARVCGFESHHRHQNSMARKPSKIKASGGFWGRFSKPQKIQFYRWHSVFGVKKRFWGSEMKKISLPFFISENRQKSGLQKYNHFLKEIWSLWKRDKVYFERNCIFVDTVRNIFFKREEEFRYNKKINLFCENQLN